jgi:hypothetical protein
LKARHVSGEQERATKRLAYGHGSETLFPSTTQPELSKRNLTRHQRACKTGDIEREWVEGIEGIARFENECVVVVARRDAKGTRSCLGARTQARGDARGIGTGSLVQNK